MSLVDLPFKPGIYTEATARGTGKVGLWKDCDKVRFSDGLPEKFKGWVKVNATPILGAARGSIDWRTISPIISYAGVGTSYKLYVMNAGVFYDITPIRSSGALTDPFTTTNGSAVVAVSDVAHGALVGDFVHYSGASAVGGITIDGEYVVTEVTSTDGYKITHTSAATSGATGGGSVSYQYEINVGNVNSVVGRGFGSGAFGAETWGTPRTTSSLLNMARTWAVDTWGEDLIASPRNGGVYVWDSSVGPGTRATVISAAPATAKSIFVSSEDRHLVALGADDPLMIKWCDTENYTQWTPSLTNTAGDKRLDQGNEIYCAIKLRGENLIFTDSHLFSMVFTGGQEVFSFRQLGDNGGIRGPNAGNTFEGVAYWMGESNFFVYDGVIRVIPCTVQKYVFEDFNSFQRAKVWCGVNRDSRELWWMYPSADSTEVDRYVIYNLQEKVWYYGTLGRTMFVGDSDVFEYPYAISPDGYLYWHEFGTDADGQAMSAYLESGDVEIDAGGNQIAHVSKLIPDFQTFSGSVDFTITTKKYPQATETQASGPHTVSPTTHFINPRVRGRQVRFRLDSDAVGDDWRMGTIRVDLIPHGLR